MPARKRLVFCGTPQFAVHSLELLLSQEDFEVVAVITQPDRPRGRGQQVSFSPVKEVALSAAVPVHQPEKIRSPEAEQLLRTLAPDCIAIIAYGQIIPGRLLPIPSLGWINLHASLLPKYRGAAPINWAIVNGECITGATTMRIDAGMDTGDMLLRQELSIGPDETAPQLLTRLSEAGATLLLATLRGVAAGTLTAKPQNHQQATYAPMLKKEDGRINWQLSATEIYNRMRGFAPWPGAFTTFRGASCSIDGSPVFNSHVDIERLPPGTIITDGSTLEVVCGHTTVLRVTAVKMEGRKQVNGAEFVRGARLTQDELFGTT